MDPSDAAASSGPIERRWWLRRFLNRLEVDRAVFYALAARGWQFAAGPVTVVLIALFFTAEAQGFYYTFASIMALASLAELGLATVLINVASHEWSRLELDAAGRLRGDAVALSRLVSLGRRSFAWYTGAATGFVAVTGAVGWLLFREKAAAGVAWEAPWLALVAVSGATLALAPLVAILEGCNQVRVVNQFRAVQALAGSLVVWAAIVAGAGLWAVVLAAGVRLAGDAWLVGLTYRRFFAPFVTPPAAGRVAWRAEVWPLQWRMAVHSATAYFAFNLFTPVMFHYHGTVAAAQMGMTWTALSALAIGAYAWVQTRTPLFGMLVARREFAALDRVFLRLLAISTAVLVVGGAAFCAVVAALHVLPFDVAAKLAGRLLLPLPSSLLAAGLVLLHVSRSLGLYLHVHKRDPLLVPATIANTALAVLVFVLGRRYGPMGAAGACFVTATVLYLPCWMWIWRRCRRDWHRTREASASVPAREAQRA